MKNSEVLLHDPYGRISKGFAYWRNRRFGGIVDPLFDWRLSNGKNYRELTAETGKSPALKVLVVGVRVESRAHMMDEVIAQLASRRHEVVFRINSVGGKGKLDNINELIAAVPDLSEFDWIIMTDDDVELTVDFLDTFLAACRKFDFKIAMPAHCFNSYVSYEVTRRSWGSLARETRFVEVGPLTAFHRSTFKAIFPLPSLRYGWGLDLHWPALAAANNWKLGVIDAVPLRHTRPIARSYSTDAALDEAIGFLDTHAHLSRAETFSTVHTFAA